MPRPSKQGPDAVYKDVVHLTRALGRAETDEARDAKDKRELCGHLRGAIAVLCKGTSGMLQPPARRRGVTKEARA